MTTDSDVYPVRNWVENCITETHIHMQRKISFGKSKILVTVFQMLKCERTGNLYKHAQSLFELCRICAESKKREAHTSLSELPEHFGTANVPEYTITVETLEIMYFLCFFFFCPILITVFSRRLSGSKS